MNRRFFTRRWLIWLTWLAATVIGMAALAPVVSRTLAYAQHAQSASRWVEVCTIHGTQWVQLDDAGRADQPAGNDPAGLHLDHCPLCVLMGDRLAPPPALATVFALAHVTQAAPAAPALHVAPLPVVRAAPPRGPPAWPVPAAA